jgi:sensor domain CHASE-containing protein
MCKRQLIWPTFLGGVKTVVPWHVLNVVHQSGARQNVPVLVDAVHCVLEGQFSAAVLLVLREYGP